ncbi:hypothetical protein [Endozoicomonas lisbonensis]|uniref:hypothetical protein n=1 Tax=Endozoicomonas lisbonensis TaxID=3120522 RepID=UPI003391C044
MSVLWNKKNLEPVFDDNFGICAGMVVTWIKKCIASNGKGVQSADELDMKAISIIQGAYMMFTPHSDETQNVTSMDFLLGSQNLIVLDYESGLMFGSINHVYEYVQKNSGYFYLSCRGSDKRSHAIGLWHNNETVEMLDPEHGLFRCNNLTQFLVQLSSFIQFIISKGYNRDWSLYKIGLEA